MISLNYYNIYVIAIYEDNFRIFIEININAKLRKQVEKSNVLTRTRKCLSSILIKS